MSTLQQGQQNVKSLVANTVEGCNDSFKRLEGLASPLIKSLANEFSSMHYKFEYEDFYSICMSGLYDACLSYNHDNPSFLSYAKMVMRRHCTRELEYWNAQKRNIFMLEEVTMDCDLFDPDSSFTDRVIFASNRWQEEVTEKEMLKNEFRDEIIEIIDDCFNETKANILKLYIVEDMRVSEISKNVGIGYKNVYSVVSRGVKKIEQEYIIRFLDI